MSSVATKKLIKHSVQKFTTIFPIVERNTILKQNITEAVFTFTHYAVIHLETSQKRATPYIEGFVGENQRCQHVTRNGP